MKYFMSCPISPLIPDQLMLWRDKESMEDLPQMAKLIEGFIRGIAPFVDKKIKKKQEKEWWSQTFCTME